MANNTKHSEKKQIYIKQPHRQADAKKCAKRSPTMPRALALLVVVLFFCVVSVFFIFAKKNPATTSLHAEIYQNGALIKTIDLSAVTEPYSFTVECLDGGFNTITVRPGAIGICDADCPDKLCVSMGYADSSLLPIVCLPHSLVIQIKEAEGAVIDGMTY